METTILGLRLMDVGLFGNFPKIRSTNGKDNGK